MDLLKKERQFMWLSYVVMTYIILAAIWWAILLFKKNREVYQLNIEALSLYSGINTNHNLAYSELTQQFLRQKQMIQGETIFFLISIIAGIFFIYRAGVNRIRLAKRQRNFILAVSHELKSPLTAIQIVLETFGNKNLSSDQKSLLVSSGLNESSRLKTLINNLLLIARQEYVIDKTDHASSVMEVLVHVIEQFKLIHPDSEIELSPDYEGFNSKLTEEELNHIFTNLLANAIKYSNEKAQIRIGVVQLSNEIRIEFSDQGIGIPEKEKDQIFNLFYRVGSEETRTTKGTGIGLYLVHQLMAKGGGYVTLKDNKPKGSVFILHFKK